MLRLPSVVLRHTTRHGSHYDWMMSNPSDPTGPLWTARTAQSPQLWAALGRWTIEPIAPHRRQYLTYQGPISNGRGSVLRVDEGWVIPHCWAPRRIIVDVYFRSFTGRVLLQPTSAYLWGASCQLAESFEAEDEMQE